MQDKKEINAFVESWGLNEVSINGVGQLKVFIKFKDKDGNTFYYDNFLFKKDGTPNKNTILATRACGFSSNDFSEFVSEMALSKGKEVMLTITKNDKGYDKVEFVNSLGAQRPVMASNDVRAKLSQGLAKLNAALSANPFQDEDPPF